MRVAVVDVGTSAVRSVVAESTDRGVQRCLDRSLALPLDRTADAASQQAAGVLELLQEAARRFRQTHLRLDVRRTLLLVSPVRREMLHATGLVEWLAEELAAEVATAGPTSSLEGIATAAEGCGAIDHRPTLLVELAYPGAQIGVVHNGLVRDADTVALPCLDGLGTLVRSPNTGQLLELACTLALPLVGGRGPTAATVVAGHTVRNLAAHVASSRWKREVPVRDRVAISLDESLRYARQLAARGDDASPAGTGVCTARELAGTALVLAGVAAAVGVPSVRCTDADRLDGHLLRLLGSSGAERLPARFVDAMGHAPSDHAVQVGRLAVSLFDGLGPARGLQANDRDVLEAAALVHDVARDGAAGDHRRGAAAVLSWPVRGVDPLTQAEIATLVRAQRGRPPGTHFPPFQRLPAARRAVLQQLAAVLRLADGLDVGDDRAVASVHVDERPGLTRIHVRGNRVDLALHGAQRHIRHAEHTFATAFVLQSEVSAISH